MMSNDIRAKATENSYRRLLHFFLKSQDPLFQNLFPKYIMSSLRFGFQVDKVQSIVNTVK